MPDTQTIGVVLTFLAGLILIGYTYFRTQTVNVLFALLILVFMVQVDLGESPLWSTKPSHNPILQGVVAVLGCILLGIIVWNSKNPKVLWGMFPILWIMTWV